MGKELAPGPALIIGSMSLGGGKVQSGSVQKWEGEKREQVPGHERPVDHI